MRVNLSIIYPLTIKNIVLYRDWVEKKIVSALSFMSIGNSINPTAFNDFVEDKLYKSKQKIIEEKNLSIQVFQNVKSSLIVSSNL